MRFFNTSGPVVAADHYCVPPLARVDLDEVCKLVRNKRYFVLHAAPADGQDLHSAGAAGPAEQRRRGGLSLRVPQRRGRSGGPRRHDASDAGDLRRAGLLGAFNPAGRAGGQDLVRRPRGVRPGRRSARGVEPLDRSRSETVGAVGRRDRRLGGRHAAVRTAPAPSGLRPAPGGFSAERGAVRRPRCARLPYPLGLGKIGHRGRQRVQRQGALSAPG